jgi:hypothetical protein
MGLKLFRYGEDLPSPRDVLRVHLDVIDDRSLDEAGNPRSAEFPLHDHLRISIGAADQDYRLQVVVHGGVNPPDPSARVAP